LKLFKVKFENTTWTDVYIVAKTFDDASEEVQFQIASTNGIRPIIKSVEIIANENGLYKNLKSDTQSKLYIARSFDKEYMRD